MKLKSMVFVLVVASAVMAQDQMAPPRPKELDALDFMSGNWNVVTKMTGPDGETAEDKGTYTGKWVMGKRHMLLEQTGTMMGMPLEGKLYVTFNEAKKQYASLWMDNWTGEFLVGYGDMKGETIRTVSDVYDIPMAGKMRFEMVIKKVSKDEFTLDVNAAMGDSKEFAPMLAQSVKRK